MEHRSTEIEIEDAIRLVADEERRRVVATMVDHPEDTVSLGELADRVAGGPSPRGIPADRDRALASLKHNHLPRLDDTGVIEYDWRSETVRYYPHEPVERLLEFVRTELE